MGAIYIYINREREIWRDQQLLRTSYLTYWKDFRGSDTGTLHTTADRREKKHRAREKKKKAEEKKLW